MLKLKEETKQNKTYSINLSIAVSMNRDQSSEEQCLNAVSDLPQEVKTRKPEPEHAYDKHNKKKNVIYP